MDNKLLISTQKPHCDVSRATVSRWVKIFMLKAGIKEHFGAHSARAAATSAAQSKRVPITLIMKTALWSFCLFYHTPGNVVRGNQKLCKTKSLRVQPAMNNGIRKR